MTRMSAKARVNLAGSFEVAQDAAGRRATLKKGTLRLGPSFAGTLRSAPTVLKSRKKEAFMEAHQLEYRGYVIHPLLVSETEGRYESGYEISKHGKVVRTRANVFPGSFYRSAALTNSIEHAKLEIDSLVTAYGDLE
jgi:hypothetical protein